MGSLPETSDWAKDLYSKFGARFEAIEARLDALSTGRGFVIETAQAAGAIAVTTPYTEQLFTTVPVPRGYSQCFVTLFTGVTWSTSVTITVGTQPAVNGVLGTQSASGSLGVGSAAGSYTTLLQDLTTGSTIRLSNYASTVNTSGTPPAPTASLTASLFFLV